MSDIDDLDDHFVIERGPAEMAAGARFHPLARRAANAGYAPLSEIELDVMAETVVALLAHHPGPRHHLVRLVDQGLLRLLTGARRAE